jgi:hypothetical protein
MFSDLYIFAIVIIPLFIFAMVELDVQNEQQHHDNIEEENEEDNEKD